MCGNKVREIIMGLDLRFEVGLELVEDVEVVGIELVGDVVVVGIELVEDVVVVGLELVEDVEVVGIELVEDVEVVGLELVEDVEVVGIAILTVTTVNMQMQIHLDCGENNKSWLIKSTGSVGLSKLSETNKQM